MPTLGGRATALMRVVEVQRDSVTAARRPRGRARARACRALRRARQRCARRRRLGPCASATRSANGGFARASTGRPSRSARHDGDGGREVLVCNVDTALIVMGLDHDFNPRRLERYLACARLASVAPVVVLTKADLVRRATARRLRREARALPPATCEVVALDATDRAPRRARALARRRPDAGRRRLRGAGKSTLTNTLLGDAVQDTGGVRHGDGRGGTRRRCARCTRCPAAPASSTRPGCARCAWMPMPARWSRPSTTSRALAARCRFRDCRHAGEPGCAVRDGVGPARLKNFHKLQRETQRDAMTWVERRQQLSGVEGRAAERRASG